MSGVIRVKVFCDWFLGISVRSGALGLFCSVGRSVDDRMGWNKLAKVVINKKLIVCVCEMCNNYGTVLKFVFCLYVGG